jgi:predicted CXXCH cytochrome family protein
MSASAFVLLFVIAAQSPPSAQATPDPTVQECIECHGDHTLTMTLGDATEKTLFADAAVVARSRHAGKATCVDCHPDAREVPHPERQFLSARQFRVAMSEYCQRCHFSDYQRTLDSVHAEPLKRGDVTAPVCVDCHGGHDVDRPNAPRTRVADTCARCHEGIAKRYAASVHGRDVAKDIADVPTCTDCHRTHDIGGPRQIGWRTSTPEICGRCHADPQRMKKYGLSTAVLRTYASDFHGKTAALHKGSTQDEQSFVALCTDCHGVHDIVRAKDSNSQVIQANLANTCRKCHADASSNFPQAWLSHYEPSWSHSPGVYAVKVGYAVFIPFIIGGLGLQIVLHLWRMAVNR